MRDFLHRNRDYGRLILRIGIGLMFIYHGYPKIIGGIDKWETLGAKMTYLGIDFVPAFWGFMAACSEFAGGILLIAGFKLRMACAFMAFTMFIAVIHHIASGDGLSKASHAIELCIVFISMILIGPGRYSVDGK